MAHLDQKLTNGDATPAPLREPGDAATLDFLYMRLNEMHPRLSPQQRRAAEVIRDQSDEVANYSLRRMARCHAIAPSHFSRLARVLGYADYEALREACRNGVRARKLSFAQKAAALRDKSVSGKSGAFVIRYGMESIDNVQTMLNEIDPALLDAVADRLAGARRVLLVGSLGSAHLIAHMKYMADMAFDNWHTVGVNATGVLSKLSGDDVVLMLGYAPYARDSVEVARLAANSRACLVAVTDDSGSPLAGPARHVVRLPTDSTQFFPSYVPALILLEALTAMVVCRSPATVRRHIEAMENNSYQTGEYWTDRL